MMMWVALQIEAQRGGDIASNVSTALIS